MNDKEFGLRVRQLRKEAHLTRECFCEDELDLSVRQLSRIESGDSKPTFAKMNFIAKRLGVGLYELMPDYVLLPRRYSKLKFEILRTPTYGDEDLIRKRDEMLTEIYEEYYEQLPEEEQIAIDAFQSSLDVVEEKSNQYGKVILDDYFEQVYRKEEYTVNDLLIIRLYLEHLTVDDSSFQIDPFLQLVDHLPTQMEVMNRDELFILRDIMLISIGTLGTHKRFDRIPPLFTALDQLMIDTQDFQKKPILNLLRWKYELSINKNQELAQDLYEEAIAFAKIIGCTHLIARLKEDWEKDSYYSV